MFFQKILSQFSREALPTFIFWMEQLRNFFSKKSSKQKLLNFFFFLFFSVTSDASEKRDWCHELWMNDVWRKGPVSWDTLWENISQADGRLLHVTHRLRVWLIATKILAQGAIYSRSALSWGLSWVRPSLALINPNPPQTKNISYESCLLQVLNFIRLSIGQLSLVMS